jgi:CHAT domain-containing protein
MEYPFDPPTIHHPIGDPPPLLLAAYEKWFLEDCAERYKIGLECHCDSYATRREFLDTVDTGATILHLSTHGQAFPDTWELSNLYFACDEDLPTRVHVFDLLAIDWSHLELVFLNSCLTSAGKHTSGEQPLSLAWGFLATGAKAVIATRWQIQDRVAFQFMKSFYEYLFARPEGNIPLAFQFARRQLRNDHRFGKPRQWMAFVLLQNA